MSHKITIKRYSQAFKQQVVREYEAGDSINELREKYGIGGGSTIQGWIERYGREGTRHKLIVIQSPQEQNQVKLFKERVAQLTLDKLMLENSLAEAEAQLGESVKKKGARRSLNGPTSAVNSKGVR